MSISSEPSRILPLIILITVGLCILFVIIRILRFLYNFIRYMLLSIRYRQRGSHYRVKKEKKKKNFFSTNDSRFRDKEVEKATSTELQATTTRAQSITERINEKSEEMQIVGIAEPIGMWTKFVTLQKLSWLKAMVGSKAESEKFWQNMIVAQQKAQSKQKGRTGPGS